MPAGANGELAFIERLRKRLPPAPAGELWLGDDAAVLRGGLLLCTDVLAEGVHFDLAWSAPADAGWKALAVNCSDIAAMGGTPRAAVAAVVVPAGRPGLADEVAGGLLEAAAAFACPLVGGDTAVGESLVVTVTVLGEEPSGGAVRRDGAAPGDTLFVTGPLGGPRAALRTLQAGGRPDEADRSSTSRLHRPWPRLDAGRAAARAGATAMIDLSDGLSTDLGHLCRASGAGARVEAASVPVGPGATGDDALTGGDDYELCFTAPDPVRVFAAFAASGCERPVAIGLIVVGDRITVAGPDGTEVPLPAGGWEHAVP